MPGNSGPGQTDAAAPGPNPSPPERPPLGRGIDPVRTAIWCTLLFLVALLPIALMADRIFRASTTDQLRLEMNIRLDHYSDALAAAVNRRVSLLTALSVFAETHDTGGEFDEEAQIFLAGLLASVEGLQTVRYHENGTVRLMFPQLAEDGSSEPGAVTGPHASAWEGEAMRRALQTRRATVAGPVSLDGGGHGIVAYQAVYRRSGQVHGAISVVLDLTSVLTEAGLSSAPQGLHLALRTSSGTPIHGQAAVFQKNPVISEVDGPGYSWELGAVPLSGWAVPSTSIYRMLRAAGISIMALLAILVYLIVSYQERLKSEVRINTEELARANRNLEHGIEEQRAAEQDLREMSMALAYAMPAVARLDPEGTFCRVNDDFAGLFGGTRDTFLGQSWDAGFDPADMELTHAAYRQMCEEGKAEFEARALRKDGTMFHCQGLLVRRGGERREPAGSHYFLRDITDRKEREKNERDLYESLARARRMESIGKLAGGVAHDLNNILGPLVAYPDLILAELPEDHKVRDDVIQIRDSALNARSVIRDLLTMARRSSNQHRPIDLNEVVVDCLRSANLRELQSQFSEIEVDAQLHAEALYIRGSRTQLLQMLMNLTTNAFEAMPRGGRLSLTVARSRVDSGLALRHEVEEGDFAVLSVKDTGEGIPEADLDHIYEPFFTRKRHGRSGTGLGLAVVYGVVRDHMGFIEIQTCVGQGSSFLIWLPLTSELPEEVTARATPISLGSERILVVDDRPSQREMATRLLEKLGYTVSVATDGRAAVEYLRRHEADLVILDMIMEQGFDGLDTYEGIRKIRPDQRCIIASGYAENDRIKRALSLGVMGYLPKPYTQENIGITTRDALDRVP